MHRLALVAAVLAILTSSFDILLVVQAGGNYRFCQVVTLVLIALAILRVARGVKMQVLGAVPLCLWLLVQALFIPVSGFWPKSLGYCFWLLLNVALVFSFVYLFSDNRRTLITLLRWYAWSFAVVAGFGIIQFCLPLLGWGAPLITQWWIPDVLPRVNGLSYEPSYFATYLLIGFVFVGSLRRANSKLLPCKTLLGIYWLTLIGIVLSSSRMGIVFLFAEIFLAQFRVWQSFLKDFLRFKFVLSKLRPLVPSLLSITVIAATAAGTLNALENNPALMLMFLNGTGISNTAAHSVIERENSLEDTLRVFIEHPLIGQGLGGVSSAIGDLYGEKVQSFEASKDFEGMSVFAEVLAASGVIGVIPFVFFLVATIRKPLKLARTAAPLDASLLRSLVRSLVFAWAILQFNQNLLRPYLWLHLAILVTVYAAAVRPVACCGCSAGR
ncbi:MAG: O-antigen ligase family protein [Bryobacteraceae bacterium]